MRDAFRHLVGLAAALLAFGCAAAMLLGLAGGRVAYLDILNQFAPFWLLGGVAAAGITCWLRRGRVRNAALGVALIAIVLAGVRVAPEWAARLAPKARAEGEQLKIIQFNAYVENVSPAKSADWLLAEDADIVVIEEGRGLPRAQMLRLRARYPYCNGCPDVGDWSNMILAKRAAAAEGRFERPRPDTNFPILGGWSRFQPLAAITL